MGPAVAITGIIMASGLSRRMRGRDKLLLPLNGISMIERVIQAADASGLDEIILVYQKPAVAECAANYRVRCVYNPLAAEGQSQSVKHGVLAASPETAGYMFLPGDQPGLGSAEIDLLIQAWEKSPDSIIVPVYGGRRGSPVIFPARYRKGLLALKGDSGGRAIIEEAPESVRHIDMPHPASGKDIDTPDDYKSSFRSGSFSSSIK